MGSSGLIGVWRWGQYHIWVTISVSSGRWWPTDLFLPPHHSLYLLEPLGGLLKCLALRLLKHCTTEYSWICCNCFCLHQQWVEEWQDHIICHGRRLSVAIKSLPGQVARAYRITMVSHCLCLSLFPYPGFCCPLQPSQGLSCQMSRLVSPYECDDLLVILV